MLDLQVKTLCCFSRKCHFSVFFVLCISGIVPCLCCCVMLWPGGWSSLRVHQTMLSQPCQNLLLWTRASTKWRSGWRRQLLFMGFLQIRLPWRISTRRWRYVTVRMWECDGHLKWFSDMISRKCLENLIWCHLIAVSDFSVQVKDLKYFAHLDNYKMLSGLKFTSRHFLKFTHEERGRSLFCSHTFTRYKISWPRQAAKSDLKNTYKQNLLNR